MVTSVYVINKGINKPIEFKGLKAQYIWYLGGGLLLILIAFAILYLCGLNSFACMGFAISAGTALFIYVYKLSHRYGQHGLMKKYARRKVPRVVKSYSRKLFLKLSPESSVG